MLSDWSRQQRITAKPNNAQAELRHEAPVRGLATSGWRGRSHSFGIADAVTVLARTAAQADVAATLIAGAVNAEHPGIVRKPACELEDDTDLGDRLVTVSVPDLPPEVVAKALDRGVEFARNLFNAGRIEAATSRCNTRREPSPATVRRTCAEPSCWNRHPTTSNPPSETGSV